MPLTISDDRPSGGLTSSRDHAAERQVKTYIAIVDDDPAFGSYLRTFLSLRGYDARCYTRGDELLAAMKQADMPAAVLLDVMMPGLDGMATLRALKAQRPEAQVIMLSGPQSGVDNRRSDAGWRHRLRGQAGRPGGARRDRPRRRDQECDREEPAGVGAERVAPAAHRQRGSGGLGERATACGACRRSSSRSGTAMSPF